MKPKCEPWVWNHVWNHGMKPRYDPMLSNQIPPSSSRAIYKSHIDQLATSSLLVSSAHQQCYQQLNASKHQLWEQVSNRYGTGVTQTICFFVVPAYKAMAAALDDNGATRYETGMKPVWNRVWNQYETSMKPPHHPNYLFFCRPSLHSYGSYIGWQWRHALWNQYATGMKPCIKPVWNRYETAASPKLFVSLSSQPT